MCVIYRVLVSVNVAVSYCCIAVVNVSRVCAIDRVLVSVNVTETVSVSVIVGSCVNVRLIAHMSMDHGQNSCVCD